MAAHAEPASAAQRDSPLDSVITKKMLLLFIIGDILGGGIYARTGEVAGEIGGAIWTGFALAAIVAAFMAASYAELVSKYPQAAGAALYIHRAFKAPLLTFVVAFAMMSSGLASAAALATAFGGDYLSEFVDLPKILVGLAVIAVVTAINFRGIKESASLNVVCTLIVVAGLLLVVLIGSVFLFDGGGDPSAALEFKDGEAPLLLMVAGASIAAVLVTLGDLETLADTTVLLLLFVFIGVHLALLALRRTPVDHDHFRAWTILPYLGIVTCAALAVQSILDDPKLLLWAGGLIALGLVLWVIERAVR